jgi:hypothetical protein
VGLEGWLVLNLEFIIKFFPDRVRRKFFTSYNLDNVFYVYIGQLPLDLCDGVGFGLRVELDLSLFPES